MLPETRGGTLALAGVFNLLLLCGKFEYPEQELYGIDRALRATVGMNFSGRVSMHFGGCGTKNLRGAAGTHVICCMVFLVAVLLVSCQAGKEKKAMRPPELPGAALFREKCSKCHELERALQATKDEAAWGNAIRRMRDQHKADISERELDQLVIYHTERQKMEAAIFQEKCQKCHPGKIFLEKNLTPSQTRELIRRMQEKAGSTVTDEDVELIVNYHRREQQTGLQRTLYAVAYPDTKRPPPSTVTQLASLFGGECSRCHKGELPRGVLKDRALKEETREKMRQAGHDLTDVQIDNLINSHAGEQNNELDSFRKVCTTCHSDERIANRSMNSEEWLSTIRRMQAKAPELITDDKVTVLAGYYHRREMVLSVLFYDNCSQCHFLSEIDEPTLSGVSANMDNLIFVASQRFGDGVVPTDIAELVGVHTAREKKEMAVFDGLCATCHLSKRPGKNERTREEWIQHVADLQQVEPGETVEQKIIVQMGFHGRRQKKTSL